MRQADIKSLPAVLNTVCSRISDCGGRAWLVGGSVRDILLGHTPKDFDLEIYGLDADQLMTAVHKLGRCQEVGKQFGVIKLWTEGMEIDLALPRTERKNGAGHRAFDHGHTATRRNTDGLASHKPAVRGRHAHGRFLHDAQADPFLETEMGKQGLGLFVGQER